MLFGILDRVSAGTESHLANTVKRNVFGSDALVATITIAFYYCYFIIITILKKCMQYEVEGAKPRGDQRKLGERLWKKTVRHVN